jgi:hypothetical protein
MHDLRLYNEGGFTSTMKRLTVIIAVVGSACTNLLAQGTVNLANDISSGVSNILTGAAVVAGTNFNAALFYLPDSYYPPSNKDFDTMGVPLPPWADFTSAGVFDGGVRTTPAQTPPGGFAWFQVRVWEAMFGSTYDQAIAAPAIAGRKALAGTSNIIKVGTGLNQSLPASLVSAGLRGLRLVPIPQQIPVSDFSIDAVISFSTTTSRVYTVYKTDNLSSPNWQPLPGATNVPGTGGTVSVTDRNARCLDEQYYRVWQVQ